MLRPLSVFFLVLTSVRGFAQPLISSAPRTMQQATLKTTQPTINWSTPQTVDLTALQAINWTIKKTRWNVSDEKKYQDYVATLGSSGCTNVDKCMKSAANPYRATDSKQANWRSDCAEFPYFLRAYFAWKNQLPFSYVNAVKPLGSSDDTRYSPEGNVPTSRRDIVPISEEKLISGPASINRMLDEMNSAMFRVNPAIDSQNNFADFYSPFLTRAEIHPGTMVYDPEGHVVTVYKIEEDGRIRYFDAHPDNSVSHSVYGEKFERSRPSQGAGFKNWRPINLINAKQSAVGFIGGQIRASSNSEIPGFSLEQYYGNKPSSDGHWSKGEFVIPSQAAPINYYDYVRTKMAIGNLKYKPVEEMRNMMTSLCQDLQDRVTAVQTAIDKNINQNAHPARLPNNIYGTDGDWETFSSPSRDARLKTSFVELRTSTKKFVDLYNAHDPRIDYQGANLSQDLQRVYAETSAACSVIYVNSKKDLVRVDYDSLTARVFKLSFDPFMCPELRWGATGAEAQTCADGSEKQAWYQAEQRLRNQVERTYNAKMNFSLNDLQNSVRDSGVDQAPDIDLKTYLQALGHTL